MEMLIATAVVLQMAAVTDKRKQFEHCERFCILHMAYHLLLLYGLSFIIIYFSYFSPAKYVELDLKWK